MTAAAVRIVDFEPALAGDFARLNLEWLEKYFHVEEIDRRVLEDPQSEIIRHGGYILFAELGGAIVGTVALKKHGLGCFELTKMAVSATQQGQGFGQALLDAALARFRAIGGKSLFLETHSSLTTAIGLYESAGFRHSHPPARSDYQRADTYMVYGVE